MKKEEIKKCVGSLSFGLQNLNKTKGKYEKYLTFEEYENRINGHSTFSFQQMARNTFLRGMKK